MTEEQKTDEKVGDKAADVADSTQADSDAIIVDPTEERAREQGWVPKDEWHGDKASWRPADVFIDRGELLGKIKSQSAELRELKSMVGYVTEQNRKLYEAGYEKAIADLEAQRDAAAEAGESKTVREIDKAIRSHEQALEQAKQPVRPSTNTATIAAEERFDTWKRKNGWYENDEVMQDWANGAAVKYKTKVNPNASDSDIYGYLSEEVKLKFPDKFKQRVGAPSPDGKSARSGGSPPDRDGTNADFDKLINTLSEEEADIARNMVKRKHVTKEEFMKSYNLTGGRR
jgi:hypothetical protein